MAGRTSSDDIDPDEPYPMSLPKMGHAVILNNVASEMPGSMADVQALQKSYETVGFEVQVHTNCNQQEMRKVKKFIMADETHAQSNCFILTIICHGNDKGQLLDKDKRKAWDTELFVGELSDVETLSGKPKIMIIQACRGGLWTDGRAAPAGTLVQDDDEVETAHILPDKADMFLAYATVPGYRAHGGNDGGSIYLQALATYLEQEYMRRPLDKILKMVRKSMVKNNKEKTGMRQCSQESNTLLCDVVFSEFHQHKKGKKPEKKKESMEDFFKGLLKKPEKKKTLDEEKEELERKHLELQAQMILIKRKEDEERMRKEEEARQAASGNVDAMMGQLGLLGLLETKVKEEKSERQKAEQKKKELEEELSKKKQAEDELVNKLQESIQQERSKRLEAEKKVKKLKK